LLHGLLMDRSGADLVRVIRERHAKVLDNIAASARRVGRQPESVRLVVVSKSQPLQVVEAAIEAGVRILGENYAEEAVAKIEALRSKEHGSSSPRDERHAAPTRPASVEWHMIGHIQGRKARLVTPQFDLIHSLDSVKLAARLDRYAAEIGRLLPVLLEFNVGGEIGKYGWPAAEETMWPQMLGELETVVRQANLRIDGLMTMPPLSDNPEDARVYFGRLRRLQTFLAGKMPEVNWRELSMGTSADYGVAVEEGATLVRVGEAILGPRPQPEQR